MLKNIQKLGTSLSKNEQQQISGGFAGMPCTSNKQCWDSIPFLGPGDISCVINPFGSGDRSDRVCMFN